MSEHKATDELREQLNYLKLNFIQNNFEELASQAAQHQWSHVAYLCRLIEGEAHERHDRATQRRIQQARFPVVKTLEQFIFLGYPFDWRSHNI